MNAKGQTGLILLFIIIAIIIGVTLFTMNGSESNPLQPDTGSTPAGLQINTFYNAFIASVQSNAFRATATVARESAGDPDRFFLRYGAKSFPDFENDTKRRLSNVLNSSMNSMLQASRGVPFGSYNLTEPGVIESVEFNVSDILTTGSDYNFTIRILGNNTVFTKIDDPSQKVTINHDLSVVVGPNKFFMGVRVLNQWVQDRKIAKDLCNYLRIAQPKNGELRGESPNQYAYVFETHPSEVSALLNKSMRELNTLFDGKFACTASIKCLDYNDNTSMIDDWGDDTCPEGHIPYCVYWDPPNIQRQDWPVCPGSSVPCSTFQSTACPATGAGAAVGDAVSFTDGSNCSGRTQPHDLDSYKTWCTEMCGTTACKTGSCMSFGQNRSLALTAQITCNDTELQEPRDNTTNERLSFVFNVSVTVKRVAPPRSIDKGTDWICKPVLGGCGSSGRCNPCEPCTGTEQCKICVKYEVNITDADGNVVNTTNSTRCGTAAEAAAQNCTVGPLSCMVQSTCPGTCDVNGVCKITTSGPSCTLASGCPGTCDNTTQGCKATGTGTCGPCGDRCNADGSCPNTPACTGGGSPTGCTRCGVSGQSCPWSCTCQGSTTYGCGGSCSCGGATGG